MAEPVQPSQGKRPDKQPRPPRRRSEPPGNGGRGREPGIRGRGSRFEQFSHGGRAFRARAAHRHRPASEMVRLASGLDAGGRLIESGQVRALGAPADSAAPARHARGSRHVVEPVRCRARGTARFRQRAPARSAIRSRSSPASRGLIYLGASHNLPRVEGPQLVSTSAAAAPIILGRGYEPGPREASPSVASV